MTMRNISILLIFLIAFSFPILALLAFSQGYFQSQTTTPSSPPPSQTTLVYYAGPETGVFTALSLFPDFQIVDQATQADVLVLNGTIPNPMLIKEQLNRGTGMILILGPDISASDLSQLLGFSVKFEQVDSPLSIIEADQYLDPIQSDIAWNSAPQIRERFILSYSNPDLHPLVIGYEDQSLILGTITIGPSKVYLLTSFLGEYNPQIQEWAYFNYSIYYLTLSSINGAPVAFHEYPGSPIPHASERNALLLLLGGIIFISFFVFIYVRRYSHTHPELLDSLIVNRSYYQTRQEHTTWEEIGFHRPLGGFILALMMGLVLFIPLIIYQNIILPVYILPSAQALGVWGRVVQFFNFLWLFLDMGTSAAFMKFFAQYRIHDPRKAIQYGQVFVWWQALSGAIQVSLVTLLASFVLPKTVYALYAWSVIIHTFIQIPGFFQVMRHALMAWQRFDYAQILDVGLALVFPILTQPIIVGLMVAWGRNHPVFGPAMGGLIGLGLAAYAAEALTFILGILLYRRLGYNTRLLFMAHFDWQIIKTSFRFGFFEMLGSVAWAIGQAMEILISQTRLVNYTEVWGNWVLAQNFIFAFNVLQTLYGNLVPSISEAISHTRKVLSQYYSAMAYKWGGLISAFIGAVLLAVADRFILGASGPEFARAALYAIPLIIWGAIQYPSWVGDTVQLGSNRPYLKAALVAGEQIIRILLALLLIERFQINGLIMAYFIGLLTKDIVAYFINHRVCYPQRFYFWHSLIAPLLAGATHYLILRWITGWIWKGDQITSVIIFLIGILFSYPLFVFLYGFFGGWDNSTLEELDQASNLSSFMRPMARIFYYSTKAGAKISPLHNRFMIDIRPIAVNEAQQLIQEKVSI